MATKKKAQAKKSVDFIQRRLQRKSPGPRPNNGGKRKGAGRKAGVATMKTRKIAEDLLASDDISPLEYLLGVLRETPEKLKARFDAGEIDQTQYAVLFLEQVKRRDKAAVDSCSYIHPRLSSVDANVKISGQDNWAIEKAKLLLEVVSKTT